MYFLCWVQIRIYTQDLQEFTSDLKDDEIIPTDSQRIAVKSLLLEETHKEDISHLELVSQTDILHGAVCSKETENLQIEKLEDSLKESILSSEFTTSETFSDEGLPRELVMTGKLKSAHNMILKLWIESFV